MKDMHKKQLAVIGVGNMGWAIVRRLFDAEVFARDQIILSDPSLRDRMQDRLDLHAADDNITAVNHADVILLAVKPQYIPSVLQEIAPHIPEHALLISIAAGFTIDSIRTYIGEHKAIARVMPNLCATVGESMSAWKKNAHVSLEQDAIIRCILQTIGKEVEVYDEHAIDAFTAIAGSGPAYVFYLVQMLEEAAVEMGFSDDVAKLIAKQVLQGSTHLLQASTFDAKTLREHVTSKGGTTEAAVEEFEKRGLTQSFIKGVKAAYKRAQELHT